MSPMNREGFTPDRRGVQQLLASSLVQSGAVRAAQTIERTAAAIAPRDSGRYAGSFRSRAVKVPTLTGRGGTEHRAGAAVENTAPYAAVVEARRQVLARAARGART